MTGAGHARMAQLSERFAFNCSPTTAGTLLMLGCFFTGTYYLCSAAQDSRFWKRFQGGCCLLGIVILLFYFWQYGYLHTLFGMDPRATSFPTPFPGPSTATASSPAA